MAVYQISKIQIRRGKKNQGTGMPQLASGELAWAIDTQELYIGSGAISEGAPSVSNVKILTETDDLLSVATKYQYKYDNSLQLSPVIGTIPRPLQSRLDDGVVNAKNFGIMPVPYPLGSGETIVSQTEKIQQAINAMALQGIELQFDPGEYQFNETLNLPSNSNISGFGKNITVFKFIGTGVAFSTVEMSENQKLSNFSIVLNGNTSTCIKINRSKKQEYINLGLSSNSNTEETANKGIDISGNGGVIVNNNFSNINFKNLMHGCVLNNSASFNSFKNCLFEELFQGVVVNDGSYNNIISSVFDSITRQAIIVENGGGNTSRGNKFRNVGTTASDTIANYSIIKFVSDGNSSIDDVFKRQEYLESNNFLYSSSPYAPDLEGVGLLPVTSARKISLPSSLNTALAFRLPLNSATSVKINYIFNSTEYGQTRKGTLDVVIDSVNNRVQLSDDYEFVGPEGGDESVIFTASLENKNGIKNLRIDYTNKNNNDTNTFTYTYYILS